MSFDLKLQNGDLKLSETNDLQKVENSDKLIQDILKIISTDLGANKKFPYYGCPISKSMVGRAFDTIFVQSIATSQLTYSITTLQRAQKEQAKSQNLTPQESIAAIQHVNIIQNAIDPRFYNIDLDILNKAFRRVSASFGVRL